MVFKLFKPSFHPLSNFSTDEGNVKLFNDDLKKASLLELVKYEYYILVNDFIKMPDIDINKVIYHKVFYYMIYNFI